MIEIPPGATPADVVGETDILPGQDWLNKSKLLEFAEAMKQGTFPWDQANLEEPMAIQIGSTGRVLTQGHHRWVAARLAEVRIPVKIELMHDYWPGPVTFALTWEQVVWIEGDDQNHQAV